jgi:1-deoxy-D-xylulose-5-phosphate reductoisomerase
MSRAWRDRPLCLLGATGTVGRQTLSVCRELGIQVHSISAHQRVDDLATLAREFQVQQAIISTSKLGPALAKALAGTGIASAAGPEALTQAAADPATPVVLTAVVGAAGLQPTVAAVEAGKRVCIANKEPLVMAGSLIMAAAAASDAHIIPVDSEHAALFQCLHGRPIAEVDRLWLTGSGGPLRQRNDLDHVTIPEALAHPTWQMGPKITIDSATLMNKALELIEARWLFDIPPERLGIVIHPQSIVHGLIQLHDGSMLAQLAQPDMRLPIAYALTWPQITTSSAPALSPLELGQLTFEVPDRHRFPSLDFAEAALHRGGTAPTRLNAANEVGVEAFLAGRIRLTDIYHLVERALDQPNNPANHLAAILAADRETRQQCQAWVEQLAG